MAGNSGMIKIVYRSLVMRRRELFSYFFFQTDNTSIVNAIIAADILFESDGCSKISCSNEICALQTEINEIESKIKEFRSMYYDMLVENVNKDLEIESLEKKNGSNRKYLGFEENFSPESLENLRLFDIGKKDDSKFILAAVRGLYSDDLKVLKKKTISGRSKSQPKEKISPKKMEILKQLFKSRVGDDVAREMDLGKFVKSAIVSINKKQN